MSITLTPELEQRVQEIVGRGAYDSANALVEEAVQRLIEQDNEEEACLNEIRARVEAREAELDRGEFVEFDESHICELARDVHERGLRKLAAERNKTNTLG